jgi:hypothetical protein
MPLKLAELQDAFRRAVLSHGDLPPISSVASPARLDIYRNTVQASLVDILATAFPVTRRIVGEQFFTGMAIRFVIAAPPRVPQLSRYGEGFADFIAHEDVAQRLPYLPDVARLEWSRAEVYFAPDAPVLDMTMLTSLSPDDMDRTVLRLHPATRLITSAFPIHRIWEVNQPSVVEVPPVDMRVAEHALVSRRGHAVITRRVSDIDAGFLAAIAQGQTLSEATADIPGTFDLQQALQAHFLNGTFRDL